MAHNNVDSLIDELNDCAAEANELSKGGDFFKLINSLEDLANTSAGFGGRISQICPAKIREQKDVISGIFQQIETSCGAVTNELLKLIDMLENMPLKDLRGAINTGKSSMLRSELAKNNAFADNNGVTPQAPVMAPNATNTSGPKSAILQHESAVWKSIKGGFGTMRESNMGWKNIVENVENLGIDVSDTLPQEKPKTLFESIIASGLPKNAGDLNSRPDPRDEMYEDYSSYLPDGGQPLNETTTTFDAPAKPEPHRIRETVENTKPQDIDSQAKTLFESSDNNMISSILGSFKGSSDFDIKNIDEFETSDNLSLEGHMAN